MHGGRLIIADASLRDARGHHYELTRLITDAALDRGRPVAWLTHREFDLQEQVPELVRCFSTTMYSAYMRPAQAPSRAAKLFRKAMNTGRMRRFRRMAASTLVRYTRGDDSALLATIEAAADEMAAGLEALKAGSRDQVLVHTADGLTYWVVLALMLGTDPDSLPTFHIATPYDKGTIPNLHKSLPLSGAVGSLELLGLLGRKVHLYGENESVARMLSRELGAPVAAAPLPARFEASAEAGPSSESLRICYLGPAREEKGFLLLPDLIEAILERPPSTDVEFFIQCPPQIVGYSQAIMNAIARLQNLPGDKVRLFNQHLPSAAFESELRNSDLVLLLYNQQKYAVRGSGIALDALCMGKPILTTSGTHLAALTAGGAGESGADPGAYEAGLRRLVNNYPAYRAAAVRKGREYALENSGARYLERLERAEQSANSAPETRDRPLVVLATSRRHDDAAGSAWAAMRAPYFQSRGYDTCIACVEPGRHYERAILLLDNGASEPVGGMTRASLPWSGRHGESAALHYYARALRRRGSINDDRSIALAQDVDAMKMLRRLFPAANIVLEKPARVPHAGNRLVAAKSAPLRNWLQRGRAPAYGPVWRPFFLPLAAPSTAHAPSALHAGLDILVINHQRILLDSDFAAFRESMGRAAHCQVLGCGFATGDTLDSLSLHEMLDKQFDVAVLPLGRPTHDWMDVALAYANAGMLVMALGQPTRGLPWPVFTSVEELVNHIATLAPAGMRHTARWRQHCRLAQAYAPIEWEVRFRAGLQASGAHTPAAATVMKAPRPSPAVAAWPELVRPR